MNIKGTVGGGGGLPDSWREILERKAAEPIVRGAPIQWTYESVSAIDAPYRPSVTLGASTFCRYSPTGNYLAVCHTASPYLTLLKRNEDQTYSRVSLPTMPTGACYGCDFSPDEKHFVVVSASAGAKPYVYMLDDDGKFVSVTVPDLSQITLGLRACSFAPDGGHVVFIGTQTAFPYAYKRSGQGTFTTVDLGRWTGYGAGQACEFSPDGESVLFGRSSTPMIRCLRYDGSTFSAGSTLPSLPTNNAIRKIVHSANGEYVAAAGDSTGGGRIYRSIGAAYEWVTNMATMTQSAAFSPDGRYLATLSTGANNLRIYRMHEGEFIDTGIVDASLPGSNGGCCFSPDGKHLAVSYSLSPFLSIYRVIEKDVFENIYPGSHLDYGNTMQGVGMALESGAEGQVIRANLFKPINDVWMQGSSG